MHDPFHLRKQPEPWAQEMFTVIEAAHVMFVDPAGDMATVTGRFCAHWEVERLRKAFTKAGYVVEDVGDPDPMWEIRSKEDPNKGIVIDMEEHPIMQWYNTTWATQPQTGEQSCADSGNG